MNECLESQGDALHPFDFQTVFLAKHSQHVVLIHFPTARSTVGVLFGRLGQWRKRPGLAETAYDNLLIAALSTAPVLATGLLAWQFQLEGQKLKGILLLHLVLAVVSSVMIWLVWWIHFRARRSSLLLPTYRLPIEFLGLVAV